MTRVQAGTSPRRVMETNAGFLMLSSVSTGVLGIVYWIVAEKLFPTDVVGRAAAVVSTATMLSSLACLSLGASYQRFLPLAGRLTRRLVFGGLAVSGAVALVLGTGFVVAGGGGDRLFDGTPQRVLFPLMVAALAIYALLDPILTGLRRASTVAVKNVSHAAAKILPLPLLAFSATDLALTGSWVLLAAVVAAVVIVALSRTALRERAGVAPALPPTREIWAFQGASFAMTLVLTVTPLCLPLIVLAQLGPENSAYYNLVAALGTAAALLRGGVLSSYVVEASAPDASKWPLTLRMIRLMALVSGASALGLGIAGPILLTVVSPAYAAAATGLVLVLAADAAVAGVNAVYGATAQVVRRLRLLVVMQVIVVVVTVGGTALLVGEVGLIGVGIASLSAQLAALAVIAGPLVRTLRRMRIQ